MKQIANGEISQIFDERLQEVRENINDKRTWASAPRKIILEITIKPDEDRESAIIYLSAKSRLAATTSKPQLVDLTNQQYFKSQGFFGIKEVKRENN
ncbi:MAG: hypothetical protein KDK45_00930 [Leptospiraceae bacterium]|nr:hypothetical protein [Leptospiraceae bacterium]